MRVLVVTPWFPTENAEGVGIFNLRDVQLLTQWHDVTVLHLCPPAQISAPETTAGDFRVVRVPFTITRPSTVMRAVVMLRSLIKDSDVLHTMALPAMFPPAFIRVRKPWVHTEHYSALVTAPHSIRSAATLNLLKRLFRRPTEVVAVSKALARVIDEHRDRRSTVIGNEVLVPIAPVEDRNLEATRLRLISVGGLVERKGPLLAADTLIELLDQGIDAHLTWVGQGPLEDALRERLQASGHAHRLHLTGQLSPDSLSRELLSADLFLLPVETETFGVAIAEALSHGLAVVATGTGGHEEFLPDRGSRLVEHRTPTDVAGAVLDLVQDPDRWSRSQIAAYARERFSSEVRSTAYRSVYRRACEH